MDCAAAAICKSGHPRLAAHALQAGVMGTHNASEAVIDDQPHIVKPPSGQHLFSLYMHTPPDYQGYPPDSPFYGREVQIPGWLASVHCCSWPFRWLAGQSLLFCLAHCSFVPGLPYMNESLATSSVDFATGAKTQTVLSATA